MSDWSEGYVTDLDYTYGYYHELNPVRAQLAFLQRGFAFPKVEYACELGFGQGLSVNIHAAASTVKWYGTDFMPEQAAFAQKLASVAQSGAQLFADSFDAFACRKDLPDFDFIGLHGIWSWINNGNRRIIVNFLKKKLKPGGVLYISYNTLPGWGDFISMRHLMINYLESLGNNQQNLAFRIQKTIDFANKILAAKPIVNKSFPRLSALVEKINQDDIHYLAHEYFNKEWKPMHFFEVNNYLKDLSLNYVCSSNFLSNIWNINITEEQLDILRSINNNVLNESVYDFITNQKFRSDLWIKGKPKQCINSNKLLNDNKFMLVVPRKNIPSMINTLRGTIDLNSDIYNSILDIMQDLHPRTGCQIESFIKNKKIVSYDIQYAIMVLIGIGCFDIIQHVNIDKIRIQTSLLNAALRTHSQQGKRIEFLASPVTGGGINVSRVSQLFLTSIEQGEDQPQEWAEYALQNFPKLGERLIKDGRTLGMEEDKRSELRERAEIFAKQSLPILKALGIASA